MALNAHRIFNGPSERKSYLSEITVEKSVETTLRRHRDEIRQELRDGFRNWSAVIKKLDLFDSVMGAVEPPALRPKFRMQGSFSYRTCNQPAHIPPQEVDLDDGMFLPVSFLASNGSSHPIVISRGFFLAVERILNPFCEKRGWTLVEKPSCVRVRTSTNAHIDIALYAIPDDEFVSLLEKAVLAKSANVRDQVRHQIQDELVLDDEIYANLAQEHVMLAHREEGWKPSDPRKLDDWFDGAIKEHGDQLRRICRYLKGWRDYQWKMCRLTSIAIMAAVVDAFSEAATVRENRDDKALLMVVERLPAFLSGEIENPVVDGQRLDEGWTSSQRAEYVSGARALLQRLQNVLLGTDDPRNAISELTAAFGDRIPNDIQLFSAETGLDLETKSVFATLRFIYQVTSV